LDSHTFDDLPPLLERIDHTIHRLGSQETVSIHALPKPENATVGVELS
jgi:hypothetical protein